MYYLSALLRLLDEEGYIHRGEIAAIISETYESSPSITLEGFVSRIKAIKTDFFRINRIKREDFATKCYRVLEETKASHRQIRGDYETARSFVSKYLGIGYNEKKGSQERVAIMNAFAESPKPHEKMMRLVASLLQQISKTYQLDIHGVKEYSGADIVKKVDGAVIGFQVKSLNDIISENVIRAETTKAIECKLNAFVLVYALPESKKVETSVEAAYHYFSKINDKKETYCSVVRPALLAELFRKYGIRPRSAERMSRHH